MTDTASRIVTDATTALAELDERIESLRRQRKVWAEEIVALTVERGPLARIVSAANRKPRKAIHDGGSE
jgi:hypothetical protein